MMNDMHIKFSTRDSAGETIDQLLAKIDRLHQERIRLIKANKALRQQLAERKVQHGRG